MSEIEKILRYIDHTDSKFQHGTPYQMNIGEVFALTHMIAEDASGAVCLAFEYGRAKGYRAAKAEMKAKASADAV